LVLVDRRRVAGCGVTTERPLFSGYLNPSRAPILSHIDSDRHNWLPDGVPSEELELEAIGNRPYGRPHGGAAAVNRCDVLMSPRFTPLSSRASSISRAGGSQGPLFNMAVDQRLDSPLGRLALLSATRRN
jgi:hypothetical protein